MPENLHRLTFRLPAALSLGVPAGRHQPCLHGCVLEIDRAGIVAIEGPSRERIFDQAARFLKLQARDCPPLGIIANLAGPGGRGSWTIIVGAAISIVPTSVPGRVYGAETAHA